jgi:hypothetical protein
MAGLLDRINSKLGDPINEIIDTPKHQAKGLTFEKGDIPLEDDDLPEPPQENVYTKPIDEIKEEIGIINEDDRPLKITPGKTIDFSKQSSKMITIADKLQTFVFGLIADVEDIEQFKFSEWEKEEFMLFLPDIAEERGITVSNELGLALAVVLALLTRAKMVYAMRKANKELKAAA